MKVAIMQPYIFPYIGYFSLIDSVDKFVFYDDVNYIKKGFINKNKILLNGQEYKFTIPLHKASQNNLICESKLSLDDSWKNKLLKQIERQYKKAEYFNDIYGIVSKVINANTDNISDMAILSIEEVMGYLGLEKDFYKSSELGMSKEMGRADRLIEITKLLHGDTYYNSPGGKSLYDKLYFKANGINLGFIESEIKKYKQDTNKFVSYLSVIDILMFNHKEEVMKHIKNYEIV